MPDTFPKTGAVAPADKPLAPAQEAKLELLIGDKLRRYYDELMAEPVPDRILDLLAALEAKERGPDQGDA